MTHGRVEKFHLSLKWKLGILLGGFALVVTLIIWLNFRTSNKVTGWVSRVNNSIFPQFSESQYLLTSFKRMTDLIEDATAMDRETLHGRFDEEKEEFLVRLIRLHNLTPLVGKKDIISLREAFLEYHAQTSTLIDLQLANSKIRDDQSEEYWKQLDVVSVLRITMEKRLEQMVGDRDRWVRQTLSQTVERVQTLLSRSLFLGTTTFIILIFFSIYLVQAIVKPISILSRMTTEIAKGHLNHETAFTQFARDEIGQLATSFRTMTEGLKETTVSKYYVDNIIHSMGDTLIVFDRNTRITMVNSATQMLLGYSEDELLGEAYHKILIKPVITKKSVAYLLKKKNVKNIEGVYRAKDGRTINISFSPSVMSDQNGHIQGIVCVAKDIGDRILLEETLRQAKETAEAASQAKSEFLTRMSHELRTPLNSVIGFTNIILKNKKQNLNEKDRLYLNRVLSNGTHLLNLINDLLDLSKIEAGKTELHITTVALDNLIHDTINQLEGNAQANNVKLLVEIPSPLEPIETDGDRLKQILINLIGNAIKFTDHGNVTTQVLADSNSHHPIQINVIDEGIGIDDDRLDAIFDAFQQADSSMSRKYEGTGLGLAISRSLCLLMNYDLTVQSNLNEGSVFSISLDNSTVPTV